MAFRFKMIAEGAEDKDATFTQWYDEPHPSSTVTVATKLRAANPDARLYIQRHAGSVEDLNKSPDNGR